MPNPSATYIVPYPFCRYEVTLPDEEGHYTIHSWRPGTTKPLHPWDEVFADGLGEQLLTLVSRHKPGGFLERAFYTRQWRDPDGKVFGKGTLRWCLVAKFQRLTYGYGFPYIVRDLALAI